MTHDWNVDVVNIKFHIHVFIELVLKVDLTMNSTSVTYNWEIRSGLSLDRMLFMSKMRVVAFILIFENI